MSNTGSASRRAALRAQQEAEAKRKRTNRILIVAFSVLATIIVAIVAVVVVQQMTASSKGGADQITPPNATSQYGVMPYDTDAAADAPKVVIWEDFQCPACKATAAVFSPLFEGLAAKKQISLEYRLVPMLDSRIPGNWSLKSAIGATIADKYGKFTAYVDQVYANQPTEGSGYTDKLLRDTVPTAIGLAGDQLAEFQRLYDAKATQTFVNNTYEQFKKDGISSTPTILVNGKKVSMANDQGAPVATTEDALLAFLKSSG